MFWNYELLRSLRKGVSDERQGCGMHQKGLGRSKVGALIARSAGGPK